MTHELYIQICDYLQDTIDGTYFENCVLRLEDVFVMKSWDMR